MRLALHLCQHCPPHRLALLRDPRSPSSCGMRPLPYEARRTVFHQGAEATHAYLVRAGLVRTFETMPDGHPLGLRLVGPGGLVGLDGLVRPDYRSTAETVCESVVCALPIDYLRVLASDRPEVGAAITGFLADEVRDLRQRLHEFTTRPARARVAAFLLAETPDGRHLPREMYQRNIGEFLGLSQETVCRVLTEFRRRGWIDARDAGIGLRDAASLRRIVDPDGAAAKASGPRAAAHAGR